MNSMIPIRFTILTSIALLSGAPVTAQAQPAAPNLTLGTIGWNYETHTLSVEIKNTNPGTSVDVATVLKIEYNYGAEMSYEVDALLTTESFVLDWPDFPWDGASPITVTADATYRVIETDEGDNSRTVLSP